LVPAEPNPEPYTTAPLKPRPRVLPISERARLEELENKLGRSLDEERELDNLRASAAYGWAAYENCNGSGRR
jgi:hypothetical protein